MAKQTIGIGTSADDGTGDTLRAAFDKCNDNFNELYSETLVGLTPTKGNIVVGNGTDWIVVGVGSNDQVLTADSAQASGVKWAAAAGGAASPLTLTAASASQVPLTVEAAASQTGNLTQWEDSTGTVCARIDSSARLSFGTAPCYVTASNGQITVHSNNGLGNSATWTFGATGNLAIPGAITAGGVGILQRSGTIVKVSNNSGQIELAPAGTSMCTVDLDATAGNTRLLLWDVDAGSLKRVSVGAADSGGTGFKVLRVAN